MFEKYVAYGAPEISPVRCEGVLVVGFDISFLRGLDIFDSLGGFIFIVKRRQKSRLDTHMEILHFGGVEAEIVTA